VTLLGIVSATKELAPKKASLAIEVTPFGIITVPAQFVFPVTTLFATVKKPEVQAMVPLEPARGVTTKLDAADADEVPTEFVAVTVNV